MTRLLPLVAGTLALVALLSYGTVRSTSAGAGSTLDRDLDPVVLTGVDIPSLEGIDPDDLVAFRYHGGWVQIPVQVDERDVKDFGEVYGVISGSGVRSARGQAYTPPTGITELMYTDEGTFTGPDDDAALDSDDEVVFMAKDAGEQAAQSASEPPGIVTESGLQLAISDPLDGGAVGYVYLFESAGALDPGAGEQYVDYAFDLLSGDYLTTYDPLDGPNPEDTVVTTPFYSHHFSDRWIDDEVEITTGAATGVDILDRHRNLFAPGVCGRSEDTFSDGEGAFIANRSGPVRTIRSYVGANSGPLTQRENIFYEQRHDIRTFLRVHAIPGVMDLFDYAPAASGMTYYDDFNTGGLTVDGTPETAGTGAITWEAITGAQGSLVISIDVETNIAGFSYTSYYLDDTTPPESQCTGDAFAYGVSGTHITNAIPCTDPAQSCSNELTSNRTLYYGAPGLTVADAEDLDAAARAPLELAAQAYAPGPASVGGVAELPAVALDESGDGSTRVLTFDAALVASVLLVSSVVLYAGGRRNGRR